MNANAVINIARAQLGMDEDDYRSMLARVTGVSSLRAMTDAQKQTVVDELKRLGFRTRTAKGAARRPAATKPYQRMIHALWRSVHGLGEVQDGSREALRAFCKRFVAHGQGAVAVDPDLLSYAQAAPVIEALKAMEARGRAKAAHAEDAR